MVSTPRGMTYSPKSIKICTVKQIKTVINWFILHPISTDILVTFAFAVLALLNFYVNWGADSSIPVIWAVVLTLLIVLPLLFRRFYPLPVLGLITIGIMIYRYFNIPESSFTFYALLLAYFGAGAYGKRNYRDWVRAAAGLVVIGMLAYSVFFVETGSSAPARTILYQISVVLLNIFLLAAAWWIGEIFRSLREREIQLQERTVQLEKERDENAHRAVLDERVRIARELHDVVAHHVSVMGIQAGAARRVLKQQPEKANDMLSQIESSSRQAVGELQRLLGFLRQQNQVDDIAPQPGLKQIDGLLEQIRAAGLPVDLKIEGSVIPLSAGIDLAIYRIIQEALTNTLKHAGPATATVRVQYEENNIAVEIEDNGHSTAPGPENENKGRGLIGMRERVSLHGGEFRAGRLPQGGFLVRATLPLTGWTK
jgi:signal transduction histidine kinase